MNLIPALGFIFKFHKHPVFTAAVAIIMVVFISVSFQYFAIWASKRIKHFYSNSTFIIHTSNLEFRTKRFRKDKPAKIEHWGSLFFNR